MLSSRSTHKFGQKKDKPRPGSRESKSSFVHIPLETKGLKRFESLSRDEFLDYMKMDAFGLPEIDETFANFIKTEFYDRTRNAQTKLDDVLVRDYEFGSLLSQYTQVIHEARRFLTIVKQNPMEDLLKSTEVYVFKKKQILLSRLNQIAGLIVSSREDSLQKIRSELIELKRQIKHTIIARPIKIDDTTEFEDKFYLKVSIQIAKEMHQNDLAMSLKRMGPKEARRYINEMESGNVLLTKRAGTLTFSDYIRRLYKNFCALSAVTESTLSAFLGTDAYSIRNRLLLLESKDCSLASILILNSYFIELEIVSKQTIRYRRKEIDIWNDILSYVESLKNEFNYFHYPLFQQYYWLAKLTIATLKKNQAEREVAYHALLSNLKNIEIYNSDPDEFNEKFNNELFLRIFEYQFNHEACFTAEEIASYKKDSNKVYQHFHVFVHIAKEEFALNNFLEAKNMLSKAIYLSLLSEDHLPHICYVDRAIARYHLHEKPDAILNDLTIATWICRVNHLNIEAKRILWLMARLEVRFQRYHSGSISLYHARQLFIPSSMTLDSSAKELKKLQGGEFKESKISFAELERSFSEDFLTKMNHNSDLSALRAIDHLFLSECKAYCDGSKIKSVQDYCVSYLVFSSENANFTLNRADSLWKNIQSYHRFDYSYYSFNFVPIVDSVLNSLNQLQEYSNLGSFYRSDDFQKSLRAYDSFIRLKLLSLRRSPQPYFMNLLGDARDNFIKKSIIDMAYEQGIEEGRKIEKMLIIDNMSLEYFAQHDDFKYLDRAKSRYNIFEAGSHGRFDKARTLLGDGYSKKMIDEKGLLLQMWMQQARFVKKSRFEIFFKEDEFYCYVQAIMEANKFKYEAMSTLTKLLYEVARINLARLAGNEEDAKIFYERLLDIIHHEVLTQVQVDRIDDFVHGSVIEAILWFQRTYLFKCHSSTESHTYIDLLKARDLKLAGEYSEAINYLTSLLPEKYDFYNPVNPQLFVDRAHMQLCSGWDSKQIKNDFFFALYICKIEHWDHEAHKILWLFSRLHLVLNEQDASAKLFDQVILYLRNKWCNPRSTGAESGETLANSDLSELVIAKLENAINNPSNIHFMDALHYCELVFSVDFKPLSKDAERILTAMTKLLEKEISILNDIKAGKPIFIALSLSDSIAAPEVKSQDKITPQTLLAKSPSSIEIPIKVQKCFDSIAIVDEKSRDESFKTLIDFLKKQQKQYSDKVYEEVPGSKICALLIEIKSKCLQIEKDFASGKSIYSESIMQFKHLLINMWSKSPECSSGLLTEMVKRASVFKTCHFKLQNFLRKQIEQEKEIKREQIKQLNRQQANLRAEQERKEKLHAQLAEQAKERAAAEKVEQERLAREKASQEKAEREKALKMKEKKEKAARKKAEKAKAENEKVEMEKAERAKAEKEKAEKETVAKEKNERELLSVTNELKKPNVEAIKAKSVVIVPLPSSIITSLPVSQPVIKQNPEKKFKLNYSEYSISDFTPFDRDLMLLYEKNPLTFICGGYVRDKLLEQLYPGWKIPASEKLDIDAVTGASEAVIRSVYHHGYEIVKKVIEVPKSATETDDPTKLHGVLFTIIKMSKMKVPEREFQLWQSPDLMNPVSDDPCLTQALKRDFTVNSLLLDLPTRKIIDPLGRGVKDLNNGSIVIIDPKMQVDSFFNPATASFTEDPVRMIRLADLSIKRPLTASFETLSAIKTCLSQFLIHGNIEDAIEINSYLNKLFSNKLDIWHNFEKLIELNVIGTLFPQLNIFIKKQSKNILYHPSLSELLYWVANNDKFSLNNLYYVLVLFITMACPEINSAHPDTQWASFYLNAEKFIKNHKLLFANFMANPRFLPRLNSFLYEVFRANRSLLISMSPPSGAPPSFSVSHDLPLSHAMRKGMTKFSGVDCRTVPAIPSLSDPLNVSIAGPDA